MPLFGKTFHEVEKTGNLYYLINAFIGAYNRRTDVLAQQADSASLQALAEKLKSSTDALDAAVKVNKKK